MYYKLLIAVSAFAAATTSVANNPVVKLQGGADFQFGYYAHKEKEASANVSADKKHIAFNSSAYIAADANNTLDSGFVYGAQINLATTTKNTRKLASFIYTESDAGRWELGSAKSATATMKITGYTNACASAGGWDTWVKTDPAMKGGVYVNSFGNILDQKVRSKDHSEYARKVTYYTPELKNFQFGISYIPDTTNVGSQAFNEAEHHDPLKSNKYQIDIKNAIALGLTHKYTFANDIEIRSAIVGEIGKPVQVQGTGRNIKWRKVRTYTIGAEVLYKDFSVAAGYMNYMKSLTSPVVDTLGRNTHVYGCTGRYNQNDKLSYSLSYFASKHKASCMNATTLATEYRIASGIKPYAEITYYKTSGRHIRDQILINDGHRGSLLLLGAKVEF